MDRKTYITVVGTYKSDTITLEEQLKLRKVLNTLLANNPDLMILSGGSIGIGALVANIAGNRCLEIAPSWSFDYDKAPRKTLPCRYTRNPHFQELALRFDAPNFRIREYLLNKRPGFLDCLTCGLFQVYFPGSKTHNLNSGLSRLVICVDDYHPNGNAKTPTRQPERFAQFLGLPTLNLRKPEDEKEFNKMVETNSLPPERFFKEDFAENGVFRELLFLTENKRFSLLDNATLRGILQGDKAKRMAFIRRKPSKTTNKQLENSQTETTKEKEPITKEEKAPVKKTTKKTPKQKDKTLSR